MLRTVDDEQHQEVQAQERYEDFIRPEFRCDRVEQQDHSNHFQRLLDLRDPMMAGPHIGQTLHHMDRPLPTKDMHLKDTQPLVSEAPAVIITRPIIGQPPEIYGRRTTDKQKIKDLRRKLKEQQRLLERLHGPRG